MGLSPFGSPQIYPPFPGFSNVTSPLKDLVSGLDLHQAAIALDRL
jgi:hypothetical protein